MPILRAEDLVLGLIAMGGQQFGIAVVDPDHVHEVGESAREDVVLYGLQNAHRHGPRGIVLVEHVADFRESLPALETGEIVVDFVAAL